jgi:hypothetical protein
LGLLLLYHRFEQAIVCLLQLCGSLYYPLLKFSIQLLQDNLGLFAFGSAALAIAEA